MPLKVVARAGRPHLYISGTVRGTRVVESTGTSDRRRAEAYRAKREAELYDRAVYGARATATFAEAVTSYLEAEPRSPGQARLVLRLLEHFGTTKLQDIGQEQLDRAYKLLLREGASPATRLRNVLSPLRAILEHAARRRWCDRPAFEVPSQPSARVSYLTPSQATALVQGAAPHLRPLLVFLIGTGARMSEALELEWPQVDLTANRLHLLKTKGRAGGKERYVDLVPAVVAALSALPHRKGRVFRPAHARLKGGAVGAATGVRGEPVERDGYHWNGRTGGGQIKTGWAVACARAGLPGEWREQKRSDRAGMVRVFKPEHHPHDLRHTAASWHYALHRDLLRLQQWGGWSNVSQVQIYAHLLPEHYAPEVAAWLGVSGPARKTPARRWIKTRIPAR
jgi:integrase